MTKMRWAAMGMMFLGAYVLQAFGCSSSPAATGGGSGGECCACTVSDPASGCSNTRTVPAPAVVSDCASFCTGQIQSLQMCPGAAKPTIGGVGIACPDGGVTVVGTGSGVGGASGVGGSTGNPEGGGVVGDGNLGANCTSDAQCTGGLTCLLPATDIVMGTPGGYPNGICTADCSADTKACAPFGGICINFSDPNAAVQKRICLEGCQLGTPGANENKCHNRPDEACDGNSGTCQPFCTTDADCGTRKCASFGMCVDTPRMGSPLGSPCMTDKDSACAGGLCVPIEDVVQGGPPVHGICSAYCVLGAQEACDWRRTTIAGGAPAGACLAPLDANGGLGDVGFCFVLCDVDTDCPKTPGTPWICDHTIQGVDATFNHGVCQVPDPDAGVPASKDAGGQ